MVVGGKRRIGLIGLFVAFFVGTATLSLARSAGIGADAGDKLPRFAALRFDEVNLRVGPGRQYPIEWVLTRKGMPVEILREYEHWRQIRDWQGTIGWVHERMVTRQREVIITGAMRGLHRRPDANSPLVARAEPGVVAKLLACRRQWCRIQAAERSGWVQRSDIWGVLSDETIP